MTAKQASGIYAPDGSLYITLTDGAGNLASAGGSSGLTVGTTTVTSGTTTRILYDNAGVVGEYTLSGTGTVVAMATSPSFTTPALGTPSAGVLTNCTGTAAGLTAGTVTTNANLTGPITSSGNATAIAAQTGTGTTFAMSASPTFTGVIAVPNGSVSAPSYRFAAANDGIYSRGGTITFAVAGGNTLEFQSAGRIFGGGSNAGIYLNATDSQGSPDVTLTRNAASTLQIGTTTANALGSILLNSVTATGNIYTSGSGGAIYTTGANSVIAAVSDTGNFKLGASQDVILARDAANTLAQRNGTNTQQFNLYRTYTDASNYNRIGFFSTNASYGNGPTIIYQAAGTGTSTLFTIGNETNAALQFATNGSYQWNIAAAGHLLANTDNTLDIGANGATRPRNVYVATSVFIGASPAILTGPAAANLQLGAANAASPVAQTLSTQGSRSGTDSNVGGGNLTVTSGNGTGTGTISSLILQSPIAVGSGTGAQTQTTGLVVKAGTAVLTSYTVANLPAAGTAGAGATAFVTDASTTLILGLGGTVTGGGANKVPVFSDGTNWIYG